MEEADPMQQAFPEADPAALTDYEFTAVSGEDYTVDEVKQAGDLGYILSLIHILLDTLTEREQKVLKLRFGLEDGRSRTLEEVGKEFDVTRERIRQIEAKALRKLRHPSRSKKLKDYLE